VLTTIHAQGSVIMDRFQEINRVVAQAKNQRAEYIASIARSHPLPLALAAALSLLFLQLSGFPAPQDNPQAVLSAQVAALA